MSRAPSVTGLNERPGLHRIDTDLMLATGSIEGPYRRPHPVTLTCWIRLRRWWSALLRRIATKPAGVKR